MPPASDPRDWDDPIDQILGVLQREKTALTVSELAEWTDRARSTITNNLAVMADARRPPWVEKVEGRPIHWRLTDKGREVAKFRVRQAQRWARRKEAGR